MRFEISKGLHKPYGDSLRFFGIGLWVAHFWIELELAFYCRNLTVGVYWRTFPFFEGFFSLLPGLPLRLLVQNQKSICKSIDEQIENDEFEFDFREVEDCRRCKTRDDLLSKEFSTEGFNSIDELEFVDCVERVDRCIDDPVLYSNEGVKDRQAWEHLIFLAQIGNHFVELRKQNKEALRAWVDSLRE